MIYGMYLSAQGADAAAFHQSVLANNLANAGTTAFKRDIPLFRAHQPFDVEHLQPPAAPETMNLQTGGLSVEGTVTDFSPGSLKSTGNQLDLAIVSQSPAFFEVGAGGQKFLTRNGRFSLGQDNQLVMSDALTNKMLPVLTVDGDTIEIPDGTSKIDIAADGSVTSLDGNNARIALGQLSLVEPRSPELLVKEGDSLYVNLGTAQPADSAEVRQGMLEEADVQPVHEMLDMIQSSRGFEMNMNLVRLQDETLAQLLQSVARK